MKMSFWDAVKNRRTYYSLSKEPIVAAERILEIVSEAVKHAPSAFNSQSARVVVLLGEHHDRLWDIVKAELKKIVPATQFSATEDKINNAFRSGYGSILFFEDMQVIERLQQQFPTYRDAFLTFSNHSAGMLQFIVWTALEQEGLGASLQHYNPVIDDAVKAEWHIPDSWKLLAQMPFGKPVSQPGAKEFQPLAERIKIYK
ncbi:putative nitroreductase family protein [Thermosinus carboxydivorans Nor1]|uniref:Putative nitroreductase family protein n=2 Tax=Thermosinus TaxID=261684 RepID=A1HNH2_9FIRM|nr:putative nitroreductase family protein [Thermosinus carboxydivorans Nor1]